MGAAAGVGAGGGAEGETTDAGGAAGLAGMGTATAGRAATAREGALPAFFPFEPLDFAEPFAEFAELIRRRMRAIG